MRKKRPEAESDGTASVRRNPPRIWIRILRSAALVYVGLGAVLACRQRGFIYYPQRASLETLQAEARALGMSTWTNEAGAVIGWRSGTGRKPDAMALIFHGNAGYALHRAGLAQAFMTEGPGRVRGVALFEYPGFGARSDKPSEAAIVSAAEAAFDQARRQLPNARIFLIGESLGTGVACALAASRSNDVAGVLLLTPFTSLTDTAQAHYPIYPVRLLLRDRYDNVSALKSYPGPVVFVVANHDEVAPPRLGRRLYESYAGPKRLRTDAGETHNTLDIRSTSVWWRESMRFLNAPDAD